MADSPAQRQARFRAKNRERINAQRREKYDAEARAARYRGIKSHSPTNKTINKAINNWRKAT